MAPPRLVLVTDRRRFALSESAVEERVGWLLDAGVDAVQVRERDLPDRALVALVRGIVGRAAPGRARVLVNDRTDIALAAGAAGVQLREDSIAASRVRAIAPADFQIGRSAHDVAGVRRAATAGGCDFLLFGTVFPSRSKPDQDGAGLDALADACAAAPIPVIAIGGITAANAAGVIRAGAAGVAVVDALLASVSAADARRRVAELRAAIDSGA